MLLSIKNVVQLSLWLLVHPLLIALAAGMLHWLLVCFCSLFDIQLCILSSAWCELHSWNCMRVIHTMPEVQAPRKQRASQALVLELQVPVIYGFGHGLSYTDLQYSSLRVSAEPLSSASGAGSYNVSVDVRNAGRC